MTELMLADGEVVDEETIISEINAEHDACVPAGAKMLSHAINAGIKLIKIKSICEHGKFMPWVKKNCRFSHSQALRYMRTANSSRGTNLDSPEVIEYLLSMLSGSTREARRKAEEITLNPTIDNTMYTLIISEFQKAKIEDASIDAIITDPPYPREFIPLFGDLSQFAARVLKPGGSLVVMSGQSYLPEVIRLLAEHMTYRWCCAYLTPGGQAVQLWDRTVNTFWKPLFWFTNGDPGEERWIGDVCRSAVNDNDKRFHGWGQSESGMGDVVERFTKPEELILDPFLGGGTTAITALRMGRRFIGIDVDGSHVKTSQERIEHECRGTNGLAGS